MKIRDAIQRIGWRFGEAAKKTNKSFTINKQDVDAIEVIAEHYEKQSSMQASNNQLLIKMYIWHRIEMMKHYKEDIFGVQTQKALANTLCKPTNVFFKRFTDFLNESEYIAFVGDDNALKRPNFILDEKAKNELADRIQKKMQENPEMFKALTGQVWEIEDVKDNLISEVNQLMLIANNN